MGFIIICFNKVNLFIKKTDKTKVFYRENKDFLSKKHESKEEDVCIFINGIIHIEIFYIG